MYKLGMCKGGRHQAEKQGVISKHVIDVFPIFLSILHESVPDLELLSSIEFSWFLGNSRQKKLLKTLFLIILKNNLSRGVTSEEWWCEMSSCSLPLMLQVGQLVTSFKLSYNSTKDSLLNTQTHLRDLCIETS